MEKGHSRALSHFGGLPKPGKCRPILESFSISAPVAAWRFVLRHIDG